MPPASRGHFRTMKKETNSHKLELDRFEEDKAVLFTEANIEVVLPKEILPKDCEEGDILHLHLTTDEEETGKREKKAKDLLNEILNGK